ncbi:rhodanese-like domain-containing protein [Rhodoferax sp.]|uniref:rhodanese-like domain-containing protein n=1 Tax=Rhodoferax sp. TaxID=50421 RepID=UPI0027283197|nr:rhodanese-like domain-containing protein [Rhodoferax sp.]MDO8318968.1 rhodanese-like domain-containing protein [Rhodoferax sp.]
MSLTPNLPTARRTPAVIHTRRSLSLLVLGLGLTLAACSPQTVATDSVTLDFARAELEAGRVILIDIREPNEHALGVAKGAQLLPMRQLGTRLSEIPTTTDKPVLLICNTQNRSSSTLAALRERGYPHVRYVQGGMSEWMRRGWPVVKP